MINIVTVYSFIGNSVDVQWRVIAATLALTLAACGSTNGITLSFLLLARPLTRPPPLLPRSPPPGHSPLALRTMYRFVYDAGYLTTPVVPDPYDPPPSFYYNSRPCFFYLRNKSLFKMFNVILKSCCVRFIF